MSEGTPTARELYELATAVEISAQDVQQVLNTLEGLLMTLQDAKLGPRLSRAKERAGTIRAQLGPAVDALARAESARREAEAVREAQATRAAMDKRGGAL